VNVRFRCPECDCLARLDLDATVPPSWTCPACAHRWELPTAPESPVPNSCLLCGNRELYKKKNFPHWLGLTILTAACIGFMALMARYEWGWAWAVLLGSAAFDGLLYLWVGDAIVCYRCNAHYHGAAAGMAHHPFELAIHERYRQERLRREQLQKP
jgi:hypothetical protein